MAEFEVSPTQDYLLRAGKPFFYLADTVWMAFANLKLDELNPTDIVLNQDPEIRAAANEEQTLLAVYSPYSFDIELAVDLTGWRCRQIDLASRRVMTPELALGDISAVRMHSCNSDSLLVCEKE
jgi:hypothetical protein